MMLFFISAFFISGVASMMSLQNNECEVRGSDGAMKYYACIAEPLHLLRNALFNIKVNPPEGTCGNPRTPFCTLVSVYWALFGKHNSLLYIVPLAVLRRYQPFIFHSENLT